MKFRTDFVTNSSSSSFVVEISLKTIGGKTYSTTLGDNEFSQSDLYCDPEELLKCSSVDELMDMICDGVADEGYDKATILSFGKRIKKSISTLDKIDSLTFRRIWYAWGEYASCFGWNVEVYAPKVYELAEKVSEADENEDKEALARLKKELLYQLLYYDDHIRNATDVSFPTGFMGSKAKCILDIYEDDLVDFAHQVVNGNLEEYDTDNGIETTVIDMQKKTIWQRALYGENRRRDWEEQEAQVADLVAQATALEEIEHQRTLEAEQRYSELRRQYYELVQKIPFYSGKIDYLTKKFYFDGEDFPTNTLFPTGGSYTFVYTENIDYWVVNDQIGFSYGIPLQITPDMADDLEETVHKLKKCIEEAPHTGLRFLKKENLFKELEQEKANNYPSVEGEIASWKASIPFDHISSLSCKGKKFAAANLGHSWLYHHLHINRKILYDSTPTKNWLIEKGGTFAPSLTLDCDYLIVGLGANIQTTKVAQALRYRDSGKFNIKIIPEDEFLRILNGEVLEISEEDQQVMRTRQELLEKSETEKQQALLKKQQQAEEERRRKAEARQAEREAKILAAAKLAEQQRMERLAAQQQKAAEQVAQKAVKAEQHQQQEENRRKHMFDNVLFMPGEEPADIRKRIDSLCAKLNEAYPDKQISGLAKDHDTWAETVTVLYRLLGYPDNRSFLEAYGYTVVQGENKGGRPTTVDPEAVIAELKRRYPNGGGKNAAQLKKDNSDLPIKTLINNAQKLFGMPLKDYLTQIGVLP